MIKIETIGYVGEDGNLIIPINKELIGTGKHKLVVFMDEEADEIDDDANDLTKYPVSEEDKAYFDKILKRLDENPNSGYSWEEMIEKLENKIGRKISIPA